jgi:hypothetical protein
MDIVGDSVGNMAYSTPIGYNFYIFFTDAKDFYVSREITIFIVCVLKKLVGERTTEVLPALQNLFFP